MTITNIPKKLIYFQIIYNCVIKFLITDYGFPSSLNYITDIITIALIWFVAEEHSYSVHADGNRSLVIAGLLLALGTFSALLSFHDSLPLYLWALRNTFRMFAFFYCCGKILDEEDVRKILDILLIFLYLNIIVCLYEYFVRGISYDYLGGLYGNGIRGGNGPLNALMIVAVSHLIIEYIEKNKSIYELVFGVAGSLFIATVGELKIFYFELAILFVLVCILVKKNYRMAIFISSVALIGIVGMNFYVRLYPERAGFLSLAYIQQYSGHETYGTSSDMNRLTAIPKIWHEYFNDDPKKVLFGLGMGNGETSSQHGFLTSSFYRDFGTKTHYDWFSQAFIFVEYGLIGLILYCMFFVSVGIDALLNISNHFNKLALICCVFLLITVFYNPSLRIESFCYTAAFLASIPYILQEEKCSVSLSPYTIQNSILKDA